MCTKFVLTDFVAWHNVICCSQTWPDPGTLSHVQSGTAVHMALITNREISEKKKNGESRQDRGAEGECKQLLGDERALKLTAQLAAKFSCCWVENPWYDRTRSMTCVHDWLILHTPKRGNVLKRSVIWVGLGCYSNCNERIGWQKSCLCEVTPITTAPTAMMAFNNRSHFFSNQFRSFKLTCKKNC